MDALTLEANKRQVFGRKVKTLRQSRVIPANIYGKKIKSLAVQLPQRDLETVYNKVGETNIVNLKVEGEATSRPVLIQNLQKDQVTDRILHVDFHQVQMTERVTVAVPLKVVGEAPAVKEKGGVLITLFDEIKVEALPGDLPDIFEVDISGLQEIGSSLFIRDLKVDPTKVTIIAKPDEMVVTVKEAKLEVEAPPTAEAAPAAEAEEKPEEAPETAEEGGDKKEKE